MGMLASLQLADSDQHISHASDQAKLLTCALLLVLMPAVSLRAGSRPRALAQITTSPQSASCSCQWRQFCTGGSIQALFVFILVTGASDRLQTVLHTAQR